MMMFYVKMGEPVRIIHIQTKKKKLGVYAQMITKGNDVKKVYTYHLDMAR